MCRSFFKIKKKMKNVKKTGTLHIASLLFSISHKASSMRKYVNQIWFILIEEALWEMENNEEAMCEALNF